MAFPEELVRYEGTQRCDVCGEPFELQVLMSGAGYFIGTECCEGPNSRESGYYYSREDAQHALNTNTVVWRELGFTPGPLEIIEIPDGADVAESVHRAAHEE